MNRKQLIFLSFLLLLSVVTNAQTREIIETQHTTDGWYVGMQGGSLFGVNTFTSFAADKSRVGWNLSSFGGYRFNSILSVEAFLQTGKTTLAVRKGDVAANYWLGQDIIRYHTPVIDEKGWDYNNLTSRIGVFRMGVRGNVNLLGFFFPETFRARMELSPSLSAVCTKADFVTINEKQTVMSHKAQCHLGIGGSVQFSYRISKYLETGIYGSFTHLNGDFDRIPKHIYKTHDLYECGLKFTWAFGKDRKKVSQIVDGVNPIKEIELNETQLPKEPKMDSIIVSDQEIAEATVVISNIEQDIISFPVIYFLFNRSNIAQSEESKLQELLLILQDNPNMNILITGWCDTMGSDTYNQPLSVRRAEAVKKWLTTHNIDAIRIQTQGRGRDFKEKNADKARRSETTEMKEK
ncbi:OmpA family protein [Bacteroides ihuae]|uniref:OmpA family protein n=1 Tax=Bacteroides ihuae TaxID=1852362 RepID=UPI0008DA3BA2|nr:OmpA family protein [Bacteroides ihuae]